MKYAYATLEKYKDPNTKKISYIFECNSHNYNIICHVEDFPDDKLGDLGWMLMPFVSDDRNFQDYWCVFSYNESREFNEMIADLKQWRSYLEMQELLKANA